MLLTLLSAIFNPQPTNENHLQNECWHPDQHPLHRFGIATGELFRNVGGASERRLWSGHAQRFDSDDQSLFSFGAMAAAASAC